MQARAKTAPKPRRLTATPPAAGRRGSPDGAVLLIGPWTTADLRRVADETGREVSRRDYEAALVGVNLSAISVIAFRETPGASERQRTAMRARILSAKASFIGPVALFDSNLPARMEPSVTGAGATIVHRNPAEAGPVLAAELNKKETVNG